MFVHPRLSFLILGTLLTSCQSASIQSGRPAEKPWSKEEAPRIERLIGNYQIQRFKFLNGLTLLLIEDHSSPTIAVQTWFKVGSRDEVPGKTGLAHLFEHMMFKGTDNHPGGDFDRLMEGAGVENENAFTSQDYTAYVEEIPSSKKGVDMSGMHIEASGGKVMLSGHVRNKEERQRVVETVDGIRGVDTVEAKDLRVQP